MNLSSLVKAVFALGLCCASACADSANSSDPIACRYEMKVRSTSNSKALTQQRAWFFWRLPDMIQTQDADSDHGEIWERTRHGSIQYRKLYHADKTAVEYMPADMPINQMNFDWFKLSSMLSHKELDALKWVKKVQVLGRNAELRKGKANGQSIEVLWLPDEKLPARIIRKDKSTRAELRLVEISPLSQARRQPIDSEDIANYRHIDAADFGDMENDPFVKKLIAAEGHHPH